MPVPDRHAGAVTVAYVHGHEVANSWHQSLMELVAHDLAHEGRVIRGGWLSMSFAAGGLVAARNQAAAEFLASRDAEWLWWVDTDMGFAPDAVDRLVAAADPAERPVVGGLCFAQREMASDGMGGYRCAPAPTLYDWVETPERKGFQGRTRYPVNAVARCAGTGSACVLIHRSVLQRMRDEFGPVWYDRIPNGEGGLFGEDLSFCMRVGALGLPVHVHTGVRTSHLKHAWVQEADYWRDAVAPPAAERCAVLVPVMRRPGNAEPFMRSLRASTGMATPYAIADEDDTETRDAWVRAGAAVLVRPGSTAGTFAEKVNTGYALTHEPWLFLVGDDVRFHAGWLDHAQAVAGDSLHVVGVNDLANPRVTAGEHATHMLVRRSYVDEAGASWDGPKVVAHEGYRHWFVDDEIVAVARQRGVWGMALGSMVEHLHPLFGTAEVDEVYELGQSHATQDRATFARRVAQHGGDGAPAGV